MLVASVSTSKAGLPSKLTPRTRSTALQRATRWASAAMGTVLIAAMAMVSRVTMDHTARIRLRRGDGTEAGEQERSTVNPDMRWGM